MKEKEKSIRRILLILYIFCIVYITVLSRNRSIRRIAHTDPFWSYSFLLHGNLEKLSGIFQNILLFVPIGYMLASFQHRRWKGFSAAVFLSAFLSLTIECVQYFTGFGWFDVDDLINNSVGAVIGAGLFSFCSHLGKRWNCDKASLGVMVSVLFVLAGAAGCLKMTEMVNHDRGYEQQFYFDITSLDPDSFSGVCKTYGCPTPSYELYCRKFDDPDGELYKASKEINGDLFSARFPESLGPDDDMEFLIKFRHYDTMTTSTYIRDGEVCYLPDPVPKPSILNTDTAELLAYSVLRAYSKEYNTYVYEINGELIWLIGCDISPTTEIVYHIYSDDQKNLPEKRIRYGFDNHGFRTKEKRNDGYLVIRKPIPTQYVVAAVLVGFHIEGNLIWSQMFRVRETFSFDAHDYEQTADNAASGVENADRSIGNGLF